MGESRFPIKEPSVSEEEVHLQVTRLRIRLLKTARAAYGREHIVHGDLLAAVSDALDTATNFLEVGSAIDAIDIAHQALDDLRAKLEANRG